MITSTVRKIRFVSDPRSTQDGVQVSVQLNDADRTIRHARNNMLQFVVSSIGGKTSPVRSEQFAQILPK